MQNDDSTIRLSKKTKKSLEELGSFSDTHESIVIRLIKSYKKYNKVKKNGPS